MGIGIGRRVGTTAASLALTAGMVLGAMPSTAYATTAKELSTELKAAQDAYDAATDDVDRLKDEIDAADKRIATITKNLPDRRTAAAETMKSLYKETSIHNLHMEIVLNSDNIEQVMEQLTALETLQDTSFGQINALTNEMAGHAADNVTRKEELEQARATAEKQEETVEELEARLDRVKNAPPSIEGCEPIDWSLSDDEIIAEWAPRIDAYLEGHGLEGQGETFVKAAIKYGVDPRLSVAISNTESTRGDFEFRSFNSWGWMTSTTFSSYAESIPAHVKYLAGPLYHGQLNAQTAQTYCPPTWDSWLANTLSAAQAI